MIEIQHGGNFVLIPDKAHLLDNGLELFQFQVIRFLGNQSLNDLLKVKPPGRQRREIVQIHATYKYYISSFEFSAVLACKVEGCFCPYGTLSVYRNYKVCEKLPLSILLPQATFQVFDVHSLSLLHCNLKTASRYLNFHFDIQLLNNEGKQRSTMCAFNALKSRVRDVATGSYFVNLPKRYLLPHVWLFL